MEHKEPKITPEFDGCKFFGEKVPTYISLSEKLDSAYGIDEHKDNDGKKEKVKELEDKFIDFMLEVTDCEFEKFNTATQDEFDISVVHLLQEENTEEKRQMRVTKQIKNIEKRMQLLSEIEQMREDNK